MSDELKIPSSQVLVKQKKKLQKPKENQTANLENQ